MTEHIAGLYRVLRGLFGVRPLVGRHRRQREREFQRFPASLWELDESYQNLLRELSKR